jgi:3-methyladenine DNA glycosylase AlkC
VQLRDMFNSESVGALGTAIQAEYSAFDMQGFAAQVFDEGWDALELKGRMRHITLAMGRFLPADYGIALDILGRVLPSLAGHGFVKMVFPDYVEVYGLDDREASMPALEAFTQEISAEFAIRPFIVRDQDRTMAQMLRWSGHEHPEVRRLASEGSRPRLPWGMALPALKADPSPILPILEQLKGDEAETVRRSVANNLNDISKDNPAVVVDVLRRWQAEAADDARSEVSAKIQWIISHALRTLLKQGRPEALELLGYASAPAIAVHNLAVEPEVVPMGGKVTLSFDVESLSDRPQNLMIDYVVHYVKANGSLSPKVWKLSKKTLQPRAMLHVARKHSFAPVTTRKYYPGEHAVEPQINGQLFERASFLLSE